MASGGSGSSGGGGLPGGPLGLLLAALLGLGAAGFITWTIVRGGGGSDSPAPTTTQNIATAADASPATTRLAQPTTAPGAHGPAPVDKEALKEGLPEDSAVLVMTLYGQPPRVSATAANPEDIYAEGFQRQCLRETYPDPCVYYYVVKSGTQLTVTAGDSRAFWWPGLESVKGGECNIDTEGQGAPTDRTCRVMVQLDVDLVAVYFGGESPGLAHYTYPTCPTQRERAPDWPCAN